MPDFLINIQSTIDDGLPEQGAASQRREARLHRADLCRTRAA